MWARLVLWHDLFRYDGNRKRGLRCFSESLWGIPSKGCCAGAAYAVISGWPSKRAESQNVVLGAKSERGTKCRSRKKSARPVRARSIWKLAQAAALAARPPQPGPPPADVARCGRCGEVFINSFSASMHTCER